MSSGQGPNACLHPGQHARRLTFRPQRPDGTTFDQSGTGIVKKIVTAALGVSMLLVAGCNTIEGAGKDVSSVGKTVSKAAKGAK